MHSSDACAHVVLQRRSHMEALRKEAMSRRKRTRLVEHLAEQKRETLAARGSIQHHHLKEEKELEG